MISEKLFLSLTDGYRGQIIENLNHFVSSMKFTTNEHGYATMNATLNLSKQTAYWLSRRKGLTAASLYWNSLPIWEGRLEQIGTTSSSSQIQLRANGWWRAFSDVLVSAAWSTTKFDRFKPGVAVNNNIKMYQHDNNGRIFIGLTKGASYANNADGAIYYIDVPHNSDRLWSWVQFNYNYVLPANWTVRVCVCDTAFTSTTYYNLTTVGGTASGSFTQDMSAAADLRFFFQVYNSTGGASAPAGESGTNYFRVDSIRLTTDNGTVTADEIVRALLTKVSGINAGQLSSSTGEISNPSIDIKDFIIEDMRVGDVIDRLASMGDAGSTLVPWECGVYDYQRLFFRPRATNSRTWFADTETTLSYDINNLANRAYVKYKNLDNTDLRTAISSDAKTAELWGMYRDTFTQADMTNATDAGYVNSAQLNDGRQLEPAANLKILRLYDSNGVESPKFLLKSGDTIYERMAPRIAAPDLSTTRALRVSETTYDALTDEMVCVPARRIATLPRVLAAISGGKMV